MSKTVHKMKLSSTTKSYVYKRTGLTVDQIKSKSTKDLDEFIGRRVGKKIRVAAPKFSALQGRGSVLLRRLRHIEDVDKKLSKI